MATLSFISFGILSDLLYLGIIPYYPEHRCRATCPWGRFIYNLLMSFIAFASVSIMSSYYFERIRKTGRATEEHPGEPAGHDLAEQFGHGENGERLRHRRHRGPGHVSYNAKAAHLLQPEEVGATCSICCWRGDLPEKSKKSGQSSNPYYFEKKLHGLRPGHFGYVD